MKIFSLESNMTDLTKLKVSLTKHGAHKIALLLAKYDKDDILKHLWGTDEGIKIDSVQARKNLSVNAADVVPTVWKKAQVQGTDTINALVLVAIVFSHNELINAMKNGAGNVSPTGTIIRGKQLDGKAFTNFAHTIEQLGFSTDHASNHVSYDLQKIFQIKGLNALVADVLDLKLTAAGWDKKNTLLEEVIRTEFYKVFAITKERFIDWLSIGVLSSEILMEDAAFFLATDESAVAKPFKFTSGHSKKKTGKVSVSAPNSDVFATLLHNAIQNKLHAELVKKYGEKHVGTEVSTGQGTAIDLVVNTDKICWFYEIKTATSAKACIRQAIPQLLEYAYWDGDADRANRLIVVGPVPCTAQAKTYLKFLREQFCIPIYYEAFDVNNA